MWTQKLRSRKADPDNKSWLSNRLPVASREHEGNYYINLEVGTHAQVACGSTQMFPPLRAGLGFLSLCGVLCFRFPELLTAEEFRAAYTQGDSFRCVMGLWG